MNKNKDIEIKKKYRDNILMNKNKNKEKLIDDIKKNIEII